MYILFFLAEFGHNFGLSEGMKDALLFVAVSCLLIGALYSVPETTPQLSEEAVRKRIILMYAGIWALALSSPFWRPFTGRTNGFLIDSIFGVVVACILSAVTAWASRSRSQAAHRDEERYS